MCRILLTNRKVKLEWLEQLERSNGGFGNGVVYLRQNKWIIRKPILNEQVTQLKYRWLCYHTRIPSAGSDGMDMLHPFKTSKGWLVQNGTWMDYQYWKAPLVLEGLIGLNASDTATMAAVSFKSHDLMEQLIQTTNSTWVWYDNSVKKIKVYNGFQWVYLAEKGKFILGASEVLDGLHDKKWLTAEYLEISLDGRYFALNEKIHSDISYYYNWYDNPICIICEKELTSIEKCEYNNQLEGWVCPNCQKWLR